MQVFVGVLAPSWCIQPDGFDARCKVDARGASPGRAKFVQEFRRLAPWRVGEAEVHGVFRLMFIIDRQGPLVFTRGHKSLPKADLMRAAHLMRAGELMRADG